MKAILIEKINANKPNFIIEFGKKTSMSRRTYSMQGMATRFDDGSIIRNCFVGGINNMNGTTYDEVTGFVDRNCPIEESIYIVELKMNNCGIYINNLILNHGITKFYPMINTNNVNNLIKNKKLFIHPITMGNCIIEQSIMNVTNCNIIGLYIDDFSMYKHENI